MAAVKKTWNTGESATHQAQQPYPSNNQKKKRLIRASVLLSMGAIICALMYSNIQHQKEEINQLISERKKLEKQHATLVSESRYLKKEIKKLNDDEYILKLARRDFFFSKEGEIIFPVESQ